MLMHKPTCFTSSPPSRTSGRATARFRGRLPQRWPQVVGGALGLVLGFCWATDAWSQDTPSSDADSGAGMQLDQMVDFRRDVFPILQRKCLQCHGPDEAKNDFRVDDRETLLSYVEPGDLESSSLWTDYLTSDDPDMRMPPPDADDAEPLTATELAVLHVWIEQGAPWPDDFVPTGQPEDSSTSNDAGEVAEPAPPVAKDPKSAPLAIRIWKFSGLFHPAIVHFPIALLSISALFVLLSFVNRDAFEPVAYHCFWIGTVMAIAACATGWAYAIVEGYGSKVSFDWQNSAIDRHRWLGIAVAVVGVLVFPFARMTRRRGHAGARVLWLVASLALAGGVATVGYQGGELVYGEDHYFKEYERLFGPIDRAASADEGDGSAQVPQSPAAPGEGGANSGPPTGPSPIPPRPSRPTLPGEEPPTGGAAIDPESDSEAGQNSPPAALDGDAASRTNPPPDGQTADDSPSSQADSGAQPSPSVK